MGSKTNRPIIEQTVKPSKIFNSHFKFYQSNLIRHYSERHKQKLAMNSQLLPLLYNKSQSENKSSTGEHSKEAALYKDEEKSRNEHELNHKAEVEMESDQKYVLYGAAKNTDKPFYLDSELSSELNTLPDSSSSGVGSGFQLYIDRMESRSHQNQAPDLKSDIVSNNLPSSEIPSSPYLGSDSSNDVTDNEKSLLVDDQYSLTSPLSTKHRLSQSTTQGFNPHIPKLLLRNSSSLSDQQPQKKKHRKTYPKEQRKISRDTCELALDREGKVYGIKLEDGALPNGYNPRMYDDPSFFVVPNSREINNRAREVIIASFDRDPRAEIYEDYRVNLDGYMLQSLPDELNDFRDLVIYNKKGEISKPFFHLFASNNKLRSISPRVFDIAGLETLILRDNKLARIPGAIGKAKRLRSINVAQNKIKFFPPTILGLEQLKVVTIRPNRLIELDRNSPEIYKIELEKGDKNAKLCSPGRCLRYSGFLHWTTHNTQISAPAVVAMKHSSSNIEANSSFSDDPEYWQPPTDEAKVMRDQEQTYACRNASWCPKLLELVLRKISRYLISQSEIMKWKRSTNDRVYRMAVKALIYGTNEETCGLCHNPVIEPVADIMEWWDFRDCNLLPVKRQFCSGRCAQMWWKRIEPLVEKEANPKNRKRKFYVNVTR